MTRHEAKHVRRDPHQSWNFVRTFCFVALGMVVAAFFGLVVFLPEHWLAGALTNRAFLIAAGVFVVSGLGLAAVC